MIKMSYKELVLKGLDNEKLKITATYISEMARVDKIKNRVLNDDKHSMNKYLIFTTLFMLFHFYVEVAIAQLIHQNPQLIFGLNLGFWELGGALALRYVYKLSFLAYKSIF